MVLLDVVASGDGTLEVRCLIEGKGSAFALEVTRGSGMPIRVRTSCTERKGAAFLRFRRGGMSERAGHETKSLGDTLGLLPLLRRGGLGWIALVRGGRGGGMNIIIIIIIIGIGAIEAAGRDGWTSGRGQGIDSVI